jgi:predicted Zn-dependent protease
MSPGNAAMQKVEAKAETLDTKDQLRQLTLKTDEGPVAVAPAPNWFLQVAIVGAGQIVDRWIAPEPPCCVQPPPG